VGGQLAWAAELDASVLGSLASTLAGACTDEFALELGEPSEHGQHQAAMRCRQEALQRLATGETQADIARSYAVDPTTIGRLQGALDGM
jgi:hypothetical protein